MSKICHSVPACEAAAGQTDNKAEVSVHTMSRTDQDGMLYHMRNSLSREMERSWVRVSSNNRQKNIKTGATRGEKMKKSWKKPGKQWMMWRVMRNAPPYIFQSTALASRHLGSSLAGFTAPGTVGAKSWSVNPKPKNWKGYKSSPLGQKPDFMSYFQWWCISRTHAGTHVPGWLYKPSTL